MIVGCRQLAETMTKLRPQFAAMGCRSAGQTLIRVRQISESCHWIEKFVNEILTNGSACRVGRCDFCNRNLFTAHCAFLFFPLQRQYHDTCDLSAAVMRALAQNGSFRGQLRAACLRQLSTTSHLSRLQSPKASKPKTFKPRLISLKEALSTGSKREVKPVPHSRVDSVSQTTRCCEVE